MSFGPKFGLFVALFMAMSSSMALSQPRDGALIDGEFRDALMEVERGEFDTAIRHLSALANETHAPRIYLELARALYLNGKDEDARKLFIYIYENNPPVDVKATILTFIDRIDMRRGKFAFGIRGERASNPLSEPTSSVFQFNGMTLTNANAPQYQDSMGIVYSARYEKQFTENYDVRSAASIRDLAGSSADYLSGDVSLGYHVSTAPLEIRGGIEFMNMKDRSYKMPYLETSYQLPLTDRMTLQPRIQIGSINHEAGYGPSGQSYRLSLMSAYAISPAKKFVTGPQIEIRNVGFDELSYRSAGWSFASDFGFQLLSISTFTFPSLTEFNATDPFWGVRRVDRSIRGSVDFSSDRIRYKGYMPILSFSCEQTQSNIDYYTTNNCTVGLGLRDIF